MYPLDVVYNDDEQIVGMRITYIDDTEDEDEEGDCCGECGAELESDGTCDYCTHFENSKNED
jgi:hypothetical protein